MTVSIVIDCISIKSSHIIWMSIISLWWKQFFRTSFQLPQLEHNESFCTFILGYFIKWFSTHPIHHALFSKYSLLKFTSYLCLSLQLFLSSFVQIPKASSTVVFIFTIYFLTKLNAISFWCLQKSSFYLCNLKSEVFNTYN